MENTLKTIKVIATITYDNEIMCDESDVIQKEWFDSILFGDKNILHNNEIGDCLGDITILEVI